MGRGIFEAAVFFCFSVNFIVIIWLELYYLAREGSFFLSQEIYMAEVTRQQPLPCLKIFCIWCQHLKLERLQIFKKLVFWVEDGTCHGLPHTQFKPPSCPPIPPLYCISLIHMPPAWFWSSGHLNLQASGVKGGVFITFSISCELLERRPFLNSKIQVLLPN